MMARFVSVALVLASVWGAAAQQIHITENFEAWAVVSAWNETDRWQLMEHIYHDLTAKKQRVDTWVNNTADEVLQRFDMKPAMEYVQVESKEGKWCGHKELDGELQPFWTWLPYAVKGGECHVNGVNGRTWRAEFHDKKTKMDVNLDLCFGGNNKPLDLFVHFRDPSRGVDTFEHVTFNTFTDGAPSSAVFDVPPACKTTNVRKGSSPQANVPADFVRARAAAMSYAKW